MAQEKVYLELPPFTGRNVPIIEIAKAMHKDAQYVLPGSEGLGRDRVLPAGGGLRKLSLEGSAKKLNRHFIRYGPVAGSYSSSERGDDPKGSERQLACKSRTATGA